MSSYNLQLLLQAHKSGSCGTRAGLSISQKAARGRAAEPASLLRRKGVVLYRNKPPSEQDWCVTHTTELPLASRPPGRKSPECQYLKQKQSHRLSMNTRKILAYTLAGRFVLYADMGPFLGYFLSTFSLFCLFRKTWKGSGREKQTTTP